MKYVETLSKKDYYVKKLEEGYNKIGEITENSREKIFAQFVELNFDKGDKQKNYYITVHNNSPYDPHGIDSHRESNLQTKLKKVSKQTFDYYVLYLKTRNSLYMTRTQRSFING